MKKIFKNFNPFYILSLWKNKEKSTEEKIRKSLPLIILFFILSLLDNSSSGNKAGDTKSTKNISTVSFEEISSLMVIDSIINSSVDRSVLYDQLNEKIDFKKNFSIRENYIGSLKSKLNDTINDNGKTFKDLLLDFELKNPLEKMINEPKYYNKNKLRYVTGISSYYDSIDSIVLSNGGQNNSTFKLNGIRIIVDESEEVYLNEDVRRILEINHDYDLIPLYYDIVFDHVGRIVKNDSGFSQICISDFRAKILKLAVTGVYFNDLTNSTFTVTEDGSTQLSNKFGQFYGSWTLLCDGRVRFRSQTGDYSRHNINSQSFTFGSTTYSRMN